MRSGVAPDYYLAGKKYYLQYDLYETIEESKRFFELHHKNNIKKNIEQGADYLKKNQYKAAITSYTNAIALGQEKASCFAQRGFARDQLNQYDKAILDYTSAIKLDTTKVEYFARRGILYYKQNQFDKAIADYIQALTIDAMHESSLAAISDILANEAAIKQTSKSVLIEAIKKLSQEYQIELFQKCLIPGNPLGDRMWETEFPWTGCDYTHQGSSLNLICLYLQEIDLNFIWPTMPKPISTFDSIVSSIYSLFQPKSDDEIELNALESFHWSGMDRKI